MLVFYVRLLGRKQRKITASESMTAAKLTVFSLCVPVVFFFLCPLIPTSEITSENCKACLF